MTRRLRFASEAVAETRRPVKIVPGTVILDRYVADKPLGFGGTAMVWQGHVVGSTHTVAIKVCHPRTDGSHRQVERLEREFQILSRICSPYVMAVSDFGHLDDGRPVLVTEFMRGVNLRDLLRDAGTLTIEEALIVTSQILRGLCDVHVCGVAHRDIKPDNIMVLEGAQGPRRVKVFDFGIAKVFSDTVDGISPDEDAEVAELFHALTAAEMTVGTPEYMSPEQISASGVGPQTDIYAVGIVLHELLFGEVPYTGKTFFEIAHRHLEGVLPPLPADLPESIQHIIWRSLASEIDERYQSADEMLEAVEASLRDPDVHDYRRALEQESEIAEHELGPWAGADVHMDDVEDSLPLLSLHSLSDDGPGEDDTEFPDMNELFFAPRSLTSHSAHDSVDLEVDDDEAPWGLAPSTDEIRGTVCSPVTPSSSDILARTDPDEVSTPRARHPTIDVQRLLIDNGVRLDGVDLLELQSIQHWLMDNAPTEVKPRVVSEDGADCQRGDESSPPSGDVVLVDLHAT